TGMKLFGERDLFGGEAFLAIDRGPGDRRMAAAQELLVDAFVAIAAIAGRQAGGDDEAVMLLLLLVLGGGVAIEAIDALARVRAHFILMNYRVLLPEMTLGAFPRGSNEGLVGLLGFHWRTFAVNQKRGNHQREPDGDRDKHRSKRHPAPIPGT